MAGRVRTRVDARKTWIPLLSVLRLLALPQIARHFYGGNRVTAMHAIRRARLRGDVAVQSGMVTDIALSEVPTPLYATDIKSGPPDWEQVSYAAIKRASKERKLETYVYLPTSRKPRRDELTHDALCSEVYLALREHAPDEASLWVGENTIQAMGLSLAGCRRPDAIIQSEPPVLIEMAGAYTAAKLRGIAKAYSGHQFRVY